MLSLVFCLSYPPFMFLLFPTSCCSFLVWFELYLHIIWFDHTGLFIELFGADGSHPRHRLHAMHNLFDAVHVGNRRQPTAVYIFPMVRLLSLRHLRGCSEDLVSCMADRGRHRSRSMEQHYMKHYSVATTPRLSRCSTPPILWWSRGKYIVLPASRCPSHAKVVGPHASLR